MDEDKLAKGFQAVEELFKGLGPIKPKPVENFELVDLDPQYTN